jgi:hypothetical protein
VVAPYWYVCAHTDADTHTIDAKTMLLVASNIMKSSIVPWLTRRLPHRFVSDVHYATKGIQGWPKIHLEVWHHDAFGRSEIYGYGFCHVPTSPGMHRIDVVTWRPVGTLFQQAQSTFNTIVTRHFVLVPTRLARHALAHFLAGACIWGA